MTTDKDANDPYIIADAKLFGFTNSFQNSTKNEISKHQIHYHPDTSTMTLKDDMPSPERPGTRPLPTTAFLLKQISEANNMFEVRNNIQKSQLLSLSFYCPPNFLGDYCRI